MSEPFDAPRAYGATDTPATMSAFLPILILELVLVAWFGFQASQLNMERAAMREAMTKQEKPVQDSKKLRDSLDAIARGTAQLAEAGNPNARLIVDELKKRGVSISPNQPAPGANLEAPGSPAK